MARDLAIAEASFVSNFNATLFVKELYSWATEASKDKNYI